MRGSMKGTVTRGGDALDLLEDVEQQALNGYSWHTVSDEVKY